MTEETDQLVTIDFTPETESLQPEPPEAPTAEADATDPEQPPSYTPEELEPEPTAPPAQPDIPAAGSVGENGAVYDPRPGQDGGEHVSLCKPATHNRTKTEYRETGSCLPMAAFFYAIKNNRKGA